MTLSDLEIDDRGRWFMKAVNISILVVIVGVPKLKPNTACQLSAQDFDKQDTKTYQAVALGL